jgi:SAM-dependent methyltransferase
MVADEDAADQIYPPAYGERGRDQRTRIEEVARQAAPCDVMRLDLTLEHAPDPAALLRAVRSALRPGGTVVLTLNNLRSPGFHLFKGRHWGGYDPPRQRRLYTAEGLSRLAAAAGLELTGLASAASGQTWVRSLRRLCQDWEAPSRLTRGFSARARVFPALFGVLDGFLRILGRGGLLVVTLRRPEGEPVP